MRKLAIFIACLQGIAFLFGQESELPWYASPGAPLVQHFEAEMYEAADANYAIVQASNGWIYVGNESGVLEFDGATWRLIPISNGSPATSLAIDSTSGTIYVGAQSDVGYLASNSLGQLTYQSLLSHIPEANRNFSFVSRVHTTAEGVFFHSSFGLFRWKDGQMHSWMPKEQFFRGHNIEDQVYVFSAAEGIKQVVGDSLEMRVNIGAFEREPLLSMVPDPTGQSARKLLLFISGRMMWMEENGGLSSFPQTSELTQYLESHEVQHMFSLPGQRLAITTITGGLVVMNPRGEVIQILDAGMGLPDGKIYDFLLDRQQGLWLAMDNGLVRIELDPPLSFWGVAQGITGGVEEVILAHDRLYVGNRLGLYRQFPAKTGQGPTTFRKVSDIPRGFADLTLEDDSLFAGTASSLNKVFADGRVSEGLNVPIHHLAGIDQQEGILLMGFSDGLGVLVREDPKGNWEFVGHFPDFILDVHAITEEPSGAFWVGSAYGSLRRFGVVDFREMLDTSRYESTPYLKDLKPDIELFGEAEGVPAGSVQPLFHSDTLWIGTSEGLKWYDPIQGQFLTAMHTGLDTTVAVFQLAPDSRGGLWALTQEEGKWVIMRRKSGISRFVAEEGLTRFTYGEAPIHLYPDPQHPDLLWIGTRSGLYRYELGKQPEDSSYLSAHIRSVQVNGKEQAISEQPTWDFLENSLSFQFGLPSFFDPQLTTYQYRLKGLDDSWSDWVGQTDKSYLKLLEGSYSFEVRARDITGTVSESAQYSFRIRPPWYRSWWAYALYLLTILTSLGLFGYLYNQHRLKKLTARNLELQEMVEERTEEIRQKNNQLTEALDNLLTTQQQLILQEKMASLGQVTMGIAHEIKNPLNFVNNYAEVSVELADELEEELAQHLATVAEEERETIREIIKDLRQNSEVIRKNGQRADAIVSSMGNHASDNQGQKMEVAINELLKTHTELAYYGYKSQELYTPIDVEYELAPELPLISINPQEIGRVIINLVSNAFYALHEKSQKALASFRPSLHIQTKTVDQSLEIRIRDNGTGISQEHLARIFQPFFTTKPTGQGNTGLGLSISYDIVVQGHQGSLTVESEVGDHTEFVIALPLPPEHYIR